MSTNSRVIVVSVWLLLFVTACGPASTPGPAPSAVAAGAAPVTSSFEGADLAAGENRTGALLTRANAALEADQLFEPAESSALDLYLAARDSAVAESSAISTQPARRLTDAMAQVDPREQIQLAIADIFPFGLIWVERAIADGRRTEAERVLGLLERAQPESNTVGRLRDLLAQPEPAVMVATTPAPSLVGGASSSANSAAPIAANTEQSASSLANNTPTPGAANPAAVVDPNPATSNPAAATTLASAMPPPSASSQIVPTAAANPKATSGGAAATNADSVTSRPAAPRAPPAPVVISQAAPRYPPRALKQRLEGWVLVGFTIRPDGRVDDVSVLNAEPAGVFDREAVGSMQRWQFQPPGQAVTAQRRIDFKLGVSR